MIRNIKGKIISTLCALTMVAGSISINTYADDTELKITKQPTLNSLTVTANKDNASYQWYKAEDSHTYDVEETVGMLVDGKIYGACYACGNISCENNGVWSGDHLGIYLSMEAGDVIKVTQIGNYEINPMFPKDGYTFVDDGTGVYTYESTLAYTGELYIHQETYDNNEFASVKIEIVRDGVTYPVVNGLDDVIDGNKIGVSQGDTDYNDVWYSDNNGKLSVDLYLENGQTVKVTTSDECTVDMSCSVLRGYAYAEVSGVDNVYTCMATDSGIYRIYIDNAVNFTAEIEVIDASRGQAITGQTTNTLTSIEEGEIYSCLVKCGDEEVWSDYVFVDVDIVKQPTANNPTVQVNYPGEVQSYQWYLVNKVIKKVVHVDIEDLADDELMIDDNWYGLYEDGKWNSEDGKIDISFYGVQSKKVTVKLPEGFDGVIYDYDSNEDFEYNDGVYELEIYNESGYMNLVIESDEDFIAEIMVEVLGEEEALEGENKATLGSFEIDEMYVCKVITKKGTELVSEYVPIYMAIIEQPTADKPTVTVNYEDCVKGYQWYNVSSELLTVVDDDAQEGEIEKSSCWCGNFVEGKWKSEDGYIDISVEVNKGDKVIVSLSEGFEGNIWEYYSGKSFSYNEGVYEYTIEEDNGYCEIYIESDVDFSADIKILSCTIEDAIEGETTKTLSSGEVGNLYVCYVTCDNGKTLVSDYLEMEVVISSQPTASNPTIQVNFEDVVDTYQWYFYEIKEYEIIDKSLVNDDNKDDVIGAEATGGTYKDGTWVSDIFAYALTVNDCIIEFEAEAGDLIELVPSTDEIEMTIAQYENGNSVELEFEDGVYRCSIEESGKFTVGLFATEEFTTEITVTRGVLKEAVAGQTEETLKNHKAGTFICKVTLENGTVLFSDVVSVAETDIVHSYTNDEDVDCNECGATRVITPKPDNGSGGDSGAVSPDTGNGINMMLIALLAGSFACAAGILCTSVFNKKRYQ